MNLHLASFIHTQRIPICFGSMPHWTWCVWEYQLLLYLMMRLDNIKQSPSKYLLSFHYLICTKNRASIFSLGYCLHVLLIVYKQENKIHTGQIQFEQECSKFPHFIDILSPTKMPELNPFDPSMHDKLDLAWQWLKTWNIRTPIVWKIDENASRNRSYSHVK